MPLSTIFHRPAASHSDKLYHTMLYQVHSRHEPGSNSQLSGDRHWFSVSGEYH
jgi:hypothetical protein